MLRVRYSPLLSTTGSYLLDTYNDQTYSQTLRPKDRVRSLLPTFPWFVEENESKLNPVKYPKIAVIMPVMPGCGVQTTCASLIR